jgi:carbonic anhydrase/acetyltransferase-like protein (isoleucine patch superfamily)
MGLKQTIRFSSHPAARAVRNAYYFSEKFSVPAPSIVVQPLRVVFEAVRSAYYFFRRVFIAEPLFKAYCHSYGKDLHTDIFVPWVQGKGKIILGDDVLIGGKVAFSFAARYTLNPVFEVGDHTGIGHECSFRVGKSITIGSHCRIASGVTMFDIPGHPMDPVTRMEGAAAPDEDVKPIVIGNNVWIGSNSIIFPGVTIGNNSVIAMGACVMTNVPSDTVVGGNPARSMKSLAKGTNA